MSESKSKVVYTKDLKNQPKAEKDASKTIKSDETHKYLKFVLSLMLGFSTMLLLITVLGDYGALSSQKLKSEKQQLIQDIKSIKHQDRKLKNEIIQLNNNPLYIEHLARKNLSLVKNKDRWYQFSENVEGINNSLKN